MFSRTLIRPLARLSLTRTPAVVNASMVTRTLSVSSMRFKDLKTALADELDFEKASDEAVSSTLPQELQDFLSKSSFAMESKDGSNEARLVRRMNNETYARL
jgi:hypothetical protein